MSSIFVILPFSLAKPEQTLDAAPVSMDNPPEAADEIGGPASLPEPGALADPCGPTRDRAIPAFVPPGRGLLGLTEAWRPFPLCASLAVALNLYAAFHGGRLRGMRRRHMTTGARQEAPMDDRIYQLSRGTVDGAFATKAHVPEGTGSTCAHRSRPGQGESPASKAPETSAQDDSLLDVGQVADYLRISRSMVYKLIEGRQIPAIRIGRLLRVRKAELDEALRALGTGI